MSFVVDASIWIDLGIGDLIAETFTLSLELAVPDVILAKLQSVDPQLLTDLGVHVLTLTGDDYPLLHELIAKYPGPGIRDLTALVCAMRDGIALLAGDGQLRKAAVAEGVRVHGVLWLMEQLVEHVSASPERVADSREAMLAAGARLPKADCTKCLERWRS